MTESPRRLSRRALLGGAGAGVVVAAAGGVAVGRASAGDTGDTDDQVVEFRGERQLSLIHI